MEPAAPDSPLDDMAGPEGKTSERRCIVTGESGPKANLLRFAIAPDGTVTPDVREKLPGRGIWVTCTRAAIQQAVDKKLFARAARRQVRIPDGLTDSISGLLLKQVLAILSMACKAGQLCFGTDTVEKNLLKGQLQCIVQATDAADNSFRQAEQWNRHLPVLRITDRDSLSAALGRNNLVHIGVKSSIVAARLQAAVRRLHAYNDLPID